MLSQMLEESDIDVFAFWEDMAYHTAPLISPRLARQFMLPRYRKVVDYGRSHGVRWPAGVPKGSKLSATGTLQARGRSHTSRARFR